MVAVIIIKKKKKGNYNKPNFKNTTLTSKSYSGHKDLNKPPFARFDAKFMKNVKPTMTNLDEDNVPENLTKLKENFETFKKDKSKEKRSFSKSSSNSSSQQTFIPEIGFGNDYQSLETNRRKLPGTENIKKTPKKSDEDLKKITSTRKDSKTFPKPSKLRKENSSSNTQKKARKIRKKQRKNSKRKQNSKQNDSKRSDSKKI